MNKVLITLAALAVGLVGCGSMGGAGGGGDGIVVLATGSHSAITELELKDFHDAASLKAYWDKAFPAGTSGPDMPQVDWSKQMVLTAFIGAQKHTKYQMRVLSVDASGDNVYVSTKIIIPCGLHSQEADQQPFTVVAAPATAKPVMFNQPAQENQKC